MIDRKIAPVIHNALDFDIHLPDCHFSSLSNNIPLYWLSAGTQEVLRLEFLFKSGAWEEEKTGVAQATAALLKTGSELRTSDEIDEAFEYYGAALQSKAGNDHNSIVLYCLNRHLEVLLPFLKEIITGARFPEEELQLYQRNLIQKLKVKEHQTDFVANREAEAQVFGYQHPYGRFSRAEDISAITRDDLLAFHGRYYTAANCQLFLAGRVNEKHLRLLEEYFGETAWGHTEQVIKEKQHQIVPASAKIFEKSLGRDSVQGALRILRPFIGRSHPDFIPMMVVNTLFGGYFGSRLMKNIREEKGFTYSIYAQIYAYKRASIINVTTEAGIEVCEAVRKEIFEEMRRLREEPVAEEELKLVKNYLFGGLLGSLDGPFELIKRWKGMLLNGYGKQQFEEHLKRYKAVSPQEVRALARKYYQKKDFYQILVT